MRQDEILDDSELTEVLPAINMATSVEYIWQDQPSSIPHTTFKEKVENRPVMEDLCSLMDSSEKLLTDKMIDNIAKQSNLYAMQKECIQTNTSAREIEVMTGIYLHIGLIKMPRVRVFWEADSRFAPIAE